MKNILLALLLVTTRLTGLAQITPVSLSALKNQINQKLTPVGTDRITGQKMREISTLLAEQIDVAKVVSGDTALRLAQPSLKAIGNNIFLVPPTGPAVQVPATLRSINEFATYTQTSALFDGSLWVKTTGSTNTTATAGYGAMVTESVNGSFYRRICDQTINVRWFGARGDIRLTQGVAPTTEQLAAIAANTVAIQKALDYAVMAIDATADGNYSPVGRYRTNSVKFPEGTYYLSSALQIKGPVAITGEPGMAFGGSKLQNITDGSNLLEVTGSLQSGNAALSIENIRVGVVRSLLPASVLYVGTAGSIHSIYLNKVWFQGGAAGGYIKVLKGDDLKVRDCTFDGTEYGAIILGDHTNIANTVVNVDISNNTIYACEQYIARFNNVDGVLFAKNRVYGADYQGRTPVGIDMITNTVRARNVKISGNSFKRTNNVLATRKGGFSFVDNTVAETTGPVVNLGGTDNVTITDFVIADNVISGVFSTYYQPGLPLAPIFAYGNGSTGTVVKRGIIRNNVITDSTNSSLTPIYMPDSRNSGNKIENTVFGFAQPAQVGGSARQLIDTDQYALNSPTSSLSALSIASVQGWATGTPVSTTLTSAGGWSASSYVKLIETGLLPIDQVYELTVYVAKAGQETVYQTYRFVVNVMGNSNTDPAILTPSLVTSFPTGSLNRAVEVRLRKPQVAFLVEQIGLEARLASGTAYQDAVLTYSLVPIVKIPH